MKEFIEKLGGRKVLFGFILITIGVVIEVTQTNGLSTNLMNFLIAIGVGFFLGNGAEHIANKGKTATNNIAHLQKQLDTVSGQISQTVEAVGAVQKVTANLAAQTADLIKRSGL